MFRLTVDVIKEAFEVTGLTPMQGDYYPAKGCACGLGAVVSWKSINGESDPSVAIIGLGIESDYAYGFACGFDGKDDDRIMHDYDKLEKFRLGFDDGKNAWEAVKYLNEEQAD